eukprot:COSAG01_NODE_789_length_13572_cov_322.875158_15_plen_40_part_00
MQPQALLAAWLRQRGLRVSFLYGITHHCASAGYHAPVYD